MAALINTGSLWLYEGPSSNAPAPLLVARVINRGMNAEIQTPDVKLKQPQSDLAAGIQQCQPLDGGAMRPPGVWDGGVSERGHISTHTHTQTHTEPVAVAFLHVSVAISYLSAQS